MPGLLRGWKGWGAIALLGGSLLAGVAGVAGVAGAAGAAAGASADHGLALAAPFHSHPDEAVVGPQPHVAGQSYAQESTNWSGQIASGTTFSQIAGDWAVPSVQPTQYSGASATWLGIDGGPSSPDSIIQTGTAQNTEGGNTTYYAWYELYPDPPVTLWGVSPGDQMVARITQNAGSAWTIFIQDTSNGNTTTQPVSYGARASRPSGSRNCPRPWAWRSRCCRISDRSPSAQCPTCGRDPPA